MSEIHNIIFEKGIDKLSFDVSILYNELENIEFEDYDLALAELQELKLIKRIGIGNSFKITNSGYKAYEMGIEKFIQEQKKIDYRKERKVFYDYQVSRFRAKTGYIPYVISFISLIISIFAFLNNKNKELQQPIKSNALEQIKDSTLFSIQTKRADSLNKLNRK